MRGYGVGEEGACEVVEGSEKAPFNIPLTFPSGMPIIPFGPPQGECRLPERKPVKDSFGDWLDAPENDMVKSMSAEEKIQSETVRESGLAGRKRASQFLDDLREGVLHYTSAARECGTGKMRQRRRSNERTELPGKHPG